MYIHVHVHVHAEITIAGWIRHSSTFVLFDMHTFEILEKEN